VSLSDPIREKTRVAGRLVAAALVALGTILVLAHAALAADYVPGQVVVGYVPRPVASVAQAFARRMGARPVQSAPQPQSQVLRLPHGVTVAQAIGKLRREPGVAYAVPNYIAHIAGMWYPDDPGRSHHPQGWTAMQWNFLPGYGVDAPEAWANLLGDHRGGGKGVVIAILDTGIAYRNWHQFEEMPDFNRTHFVDPYDFVANNPYPLDRMGHGTFVAGIIAASTNNGYGLTGLAYNASIMPVRILDANGEGDASTISQGIRYAVNHRAQVINLSLEFDIGVRASDIPDIISAIHYAREKGVVVVAAAGNEGVDQLAYPAADPSVISVGATTKDRCLADYSNGGPGLDLVAPGGGDDSSAISEPDCHPNLNLPSINQMTLLDPPDWSLFGYPGGVYGTSMSAPHVAATAALVIASQVIGRHPSPDAILKHLEETAQELGGSKPNVNYGYGLVDAGAATAPVATPAGRKKR
jgi:serine protease